MTSSNRSGGLASSLVCLAFKPQQRKPPRSGELAPGLHKVRIAAEELPRYGVSLPRGCALICGVLAANIAYHRGFPVSPLTSRTLMGAPSCTLIRELLLSVQALFPDLLTSIDPNWNMEIEDRRVSECVAKLFVELRRERFDDPLTLAYAFELFTTEGERHRQAAFYTPFPLAFQMAMEAFSRCPGVYPDSVLDPACGSGIFLIAAIRAVASLVPHHPERLDRFVHEHLYAIDRDRRAVAIARAVLALELGARQGSASSTPDFRFHNTVVCGNSLLTPEDLDGHRLSPDEIGALASLDWKKIWPTRSDGFECIIGNPPYGLSRSARITPFENEILKTRFSAIRSGKINQYLLFIARALELLARPGVATLIVPNAWLGIRAGALVRQSIVSNRMLAALWKFRRSPFPDALVEPVVVVLDSHHNHDSIALHTFDQDLLPASPADSTVPVKEVLRDPDILIPSVWSDGIADFIGKMRASQRVLGSPDSGFTPYIALQAYATGKGTPPQSSRDVASHCFHVTQPTADSLPYLEGGDIRRYQICWSGRHLRFGPWLAENHPRERFHGPRLVVREILAAGVHRIIAAFTEAPFVYNRSVLHIIPSPHLSREQVLALLAVLNSRVASLWCTFLGRKSQRSLFPKLLNDDLRAFPLPCQFEQSVAVLATLAEQVIVSTLHGDVEHAATAERQIDEIVIALYRVEDCAVLHQNHSSPMSASLHRTEVSDWPLTTPESPHDSDVTAPQGRRRSARRGSRRAPARPRTRQD